MRGSKNAGSYRILFAKTRLDLAWRAVSLLFMYFILFHFFHPPCIAHVNHYHHPFVLRLIKPPPWCHRHHPLASLHHPPIITFILLLSPTHYSPNSTSFRLCSKHPHLNTHFPNPTAFGRPWPESLCKNYQQSPTTLINHSPH